jgi:hypothetical protein
VEFLGVSDERLRNELTLLDREVSELSCPFLILFLYREEFLRARDERLRDELTLLDRHCQYLYCTEWNSSDARLRNELTLLDRKVFELGCLLLTLFLYREEFLRARDERLRDELTLLDRQVSELGCLTALNMFSVDRSLFTSILGTTLTYLIILRDIRKS